MNENSVNNQAAEVSEHPSHREEVGLPFYPWMPKPLGILVFLILYMSPVFSGGMNLSLSPDIVGDMGWITEDQIFWYTNFKPFFFVNITEWR